MSAPVRGARLRPAKSCLPEVREQEIGAQALRVCCLGKEWFVFPNAGWADVLRALRIMRQPGWARFVRVEELGAAVSFQYTHR
jgi:hypothetical protein